MFNKGKYCKKQRQVLLEQFLYMMLQNFKLKFKSHPGFAGYASIDVNDHQHPLCVEFCTSWYRYQDSFPKEFPGLCRQSSHTVPAPLLWVKPPQAQGASSLYWATSAGLSTWPSAITQPRKAEQKIKSLPNFSNESVSFSIGG